MNGYEAVQALSAAIICIGTLMILFHAAKREEAKAADSHDDAAGTDALRITLLPQCAAKNRKHPTAAVARAMTALRSLDKGQTMAQVAKALGYGDVPRLQKALAKDGKAARREMQREAAV